MTEHVRKEMRKTRIGVGSFIGFFNRDFFGSFGIIYPFALLYPAWKIYKYHHHFSWNLGSGIAGGLLLFLSVLLALAMLKPSFAGLFGVFVLDILKGYIGTLGSLLCSLAGIIIGFSLSFGKRLDTVILEAFAKAKKDAKSLKPASKPAAPAPSTQNIIKPRTAPKIKKAKTLAQDLSDKEIFPIVDPDGRVVGKATRRLCHSGSRLLHPVVHLHVFDPQGRIYLQQRSRHKFIQPGKWDTAVGGHVDYGETVEQALRREAGEELGRADAPGGFRQLERPYRGCRLCAANCDFYRRRKHNGHMGEPSPI